MPTSASDSSLPMNASSQDELPTNDSPSRESLPTLERGIHEFNSGEFYACHDTLEAIWMEADTSEKPFYQGILQISVAFYHLGNLNWRGGAILMGEGINRLGRFEPSYRDVQVDDLVDQAIAWLEMIQTAGPDGLAALMHDLPRPLPQIRVTQTPSDDLM